MARVWMFCHAVPKDVRHFHTETTLGAVSYAPLVLKGAIDAIRRQLKNGGGDAPSNGKEGALLRKLVSVQNDSSSNTIKDLNNRMTFSDKGIVTQVMG